MSEARVINALNPEMPAGYDMFSGIEVIEQKNGSLRYNGILELGDGENKLERRVQLRELDVIWGYDPDDYEKRLADPEKWEMRRQIEELTKRVESLETGSQSQVSDRPTIRQRARRSWAAIQTTIGTRFSGRPDAEPDETGEVVEESADETHRRRNTVVTAVGAVALAGAAYWLGTRHGHDLGALKQMVTDHDNADKARHAGEMKAIAGQEHLEKLRHAAEMKAIAGEEHLDKARHAGEMKALNTFHNEYLRDHKQDLQAIHSLQNNLHGAGLTAASGGHTPTPESQAALSYRGDSVYHEVANRLREKLGSNATAAKVHKATAYVLKLNGLRWRGGGYGIDAHRLPVGFHFKIPANIVAIANK